MTKESVGAETKVRQRENPATSGWVLVVSTSGGGWVLVVPTVVESAENQ